MKKNNHYIYILVGLALMFTACDKIEPDFFDEDYNGAYFDYQYASEYERTINFGEYVVGNPQSVPFTLNVKLLGYLKEEARSLSIKTKEVEGYKPAKVTIPEVIFANKEYQKEIEFMVERPEVENTTYAIMIYLDGEGDLGTGIAGKNEYTIYVTEVHEKPTIWSGQIQTYLGNWDREKHAFLATLYDDNYYYNALYDFDRKQAKYDEIIDMNEFTVNTLLAEEPAEPIVVGMPILDKTEYANYEEPYFWEKYKEYLGMYSSYRFCEFTHIIDAANTQNIIAGYENALEKMEKYKPTYHKEDVLAMQNAYYEYPKLGYTIDQYKDLMWVEIEQNTVYIDNGDGKSYVRIPYWWEDPDNLGTGEIVKKYFGDYSDAKYQFMIKTMTKNEGTEDFVIATILPFTINGNGYGWDETVGGEERLKQCYKIIKADRQSIKYKIPNVELD